MMGAESITRKLGSALKLEVGEVNGDGMFSYEKVECLGQCNKAPSLMVNGEVHGGLTAPVEYSISTIPQPCPVKTLLMRLQIACT